MTPECEKARALGLRCVYDEATEQHIAHMSDVLPWPVDTCIECGGEIEVDAANNLYCLRCLVKP